MPRPTANSLSLIALLLSLLVGCARPAGNVNQVASVNESGNGEPYTGGDDILGALETSRSNLLRVVRSLRAENAHRDLTLSQLDLTTGQRGTVNALVYDHLAQIETLLTQSTPIPFRLSALPLPGNFFAMTTPAGPIIFDREQVLAKTTQVRLALVTHEYLHHVEIEGGFPADDLPLAEFSAQGGTRVAFDAGGKAISDELDRLIALDHPTPTPTPTPTPPAVVSPTAPPTAVLYRKMKTLPSGLDDYIETTSPGGDAGYALQGAIGAVFTTGGNGYAEIFLCRAQYAGEDSTFLSTQANCESQIKIRSVGFVAINSGNGTKPLYRCLGVSGPNTGHHFASLNAAECAGPAITIEGITGYVMP